MGRGLGPHLGGGEALPEENTSGVKRKGKNGEVGGGMVVLGNPKKNALNTPGGKGRWLSAKKAE